MTGQVLEFGDFRLFPERRELQLDDKPVHLGSRALEILVALLEQPGKVVSNGDLIARVWPDTFVDDANLRVHISALRKALGEGKDGARFIANVPGRGYSFVVPVQQGDTGVAPEADPRNARSMSGHNLPAQLTHPIGREEVIDALVKKLREAALHLRRRPGRDRQDHRRPCRGRALGHFL